MAPQGPCQRAERAAVPPARPASGAGTVRAFFKGNGTNVVKIAPETAIKLTLNDALKRVRSAAEQLRPLVEQQLCLTHAVERPWGGPRHACRAAHLHPACWGSRHVGAAQPAEQRWHAALTAGGDAGS